MANRVSIKVDSDVAGAIAGLAAVRAELGRVKDAANDVNNPSVGGGNGLFSNATRGMADFERGAKSLRLTLGDGDNDGLGRDIRRSKNFLTDFGDSLQRLGQMIDGGPVRGPLTFLRNVMAAPFGVSGGLLSGLGGGGGGLSSLAAAAAPAAGAIALLTLTFLAVPAAAAAVQFAVSLVAVALTTLAAAVWAAMGPFSILFGLLGGIGLGAVLAFKNAMASSGPEFHAFRSEVSGIKDNFVALTHHLAQDFMPWFMTVGKSVNSVVGYFNQLAILAQKGGLKAVFDSLSSGGLGHMNQELLRAITPIGNVISQVIGFAFGRGGNEGEAILKGDFSRLAAWAEKAFKPIVDWFNKQHFEKTGARWARELINSPLVKSLLDRVGQFIEFAIGFAAQRAWDTFKRWAGIAFHFVMSEGGRALHWIEGLVVSAGHAIKAAIISALGPGTWSQIAQAGQNAWSIIKNAATIAWNVFKIIVEVVGTIIDAVVKAGTKIGLWHAVIVVAKTAAYAVATAFNVVLTVVNAIASALNTAVGWAQSLASAVSSIHVPSLGGVGGFLGSLIPGNAAGTPSWRGGLSWVGERGPELVNLPRGSSVYSNRQSMAMAGGVTINIYGADLSTPEQQRVVASKLASLLGSHRAGGGF